MPVHDWSRVDAGLFHHFHQTWIAKLSDRLNSDVLPAGYYALIEPEQTSPARYLMSAKRERYAARANRLSIRNPLGEVVAVIEIISPGNKHSRDSVHSFVKKSHGLLDRGIHLLIVDLFPPTVCSYCADSPKTPYVEPVAVGDALPDMPLFLAAGTHIPVPLEETYMRTWSLCPQPMREAVGGES